jgi:uncharacterized membrane protein
MNFFFIFFLQDASSKQKKSEKMLQIIAEEAKQSGIDSLIFGLLWASPSQGRYDNFQ